MYRSPFFLTLSLLLSLPLLFFLAPHLDIFPPLRPLPSSISPSDELSDLSLFRRASSSSSHPSHLSSPSKSPKIAFLFLTNTPLSFSPLWQSFFPPPSRSSLYNIYIHSSPSLNLSFPLHSVFFRRVIPSRPTSRASPTLISATRRLLATAILHDPANAYFALLSQHCIPLHSFPYVYNSLLKSSSFDFSEIKDKGKGETLKNKMGVKLRYRSYIEILDKAKNLWKRYTGRGRYAMEPEVPYEKFRVGSQFFVLTRKHALTVIRDRKLWMKFRLPCYREDACFPEEHYFPTLLEMEDPEGVTKYTLTRVNWTGTVNGHPHTYTASEISHELIFQLRKSNHSESYLFARKFAPECLEPLVKIAGSVIFRD